MPGCTVHFDWLKVGKVDAPVLLKNICSFGFWFWFLVNDGCNEEGKCGQNYSSHIMSHILGKTLIGMCSPLEWPKVWIL